ncbi:MAG TPA: BTAD domain-containing putative transcriptional regulator [Candidatus Dormibacteraeota bacterium]|nr:BTAD domain-containing putative transcriptional regulator [Candidatus Dormibacteraeota bacterium]
MLRIYLNGDICLTMDGRLLRADRLPGRQGRLVFAYLVTERARAVSRDELADCLWPRRLPAASEVALSAIVSKLRAVLAEVGLGRETLAATSGGYQLALPSDSWVDVEAALGSVHLAEAALQASNPRAAYGPSVVACAILRRPFLAGEDGAWVDRRREALRKNLLRALDCLAQIHTATGELSLALRAAEEAVDLEPLREAGYRRLMLVHSAAGNRAEALRVYAELEAMLEVELMTTPAPETRRVFEAVAGL